MCVGAAAWIDCPAHLNSSFEESDTDDGYARGRAYADRARAPPYAWSYAAHAEDAAPVVASVYAAEAKEHAVSDSGLPFGDGAPSLDTLLALANDNSRGTPARPRPPTPCDL